MTDEPAGVRLDAPPANGHSASSSGAASIVAKATTTKSPVDASELLRADAGDIDAATVSMDRSGAEQITAQRVTMDHSGAKSLDARSAQLTDSGVVLLKSEQAVMQGGSAVLVSAQNARMVKSRAVAVVAGQLTAEGDVRTVLHIGPVTGAIRPVLSGGGAVGFGAAFGLVVLLGSQFIKRLFRSR